MMREISAPKILLPYYYSWKINEKNTNFNVCFSYTLSNEISIEKMKYSLLELTNYRPNLRANFAFKQNDIKYIVHKNLAPIIYELDANFEEDYENITCQIKNLTHNLHTESLFKAAFIKKRYNNETELIFNIHHSIIDGNSLDKFIQDLGRLYNNLSISEESIDSHLNSFLIINKQSANLIDEKVKNYSNLLNEVAEKLDKENIPPKEFVITSKKALTLEEFDKINSFSNKSEISLFNLFLLCWCIFETKLFNKEQCIVNYPVDIRSNKEATGCIINNIYFPYIYNKNSTFTDLVSNLKQQLPFLKKLHFVNSVDIFDKNDSKLSHFAYSSFAKLKDLELSNYIHSGKSYPQMANSFIGMRFIRAENSIHFLSEAYESVLPKSIAENLCSRFIHFVNKIIDSAESKLEKFDLLFTSEKEYYFQKNVAVIEKKGTILDYFKKITQEYSENFAGIDQNNKITYKELDLKSDKLANFFHNNKQKNKIVAILLDNKIEMLVSILGVLKSENTYLPISPDTPADRIAYILNDSKVEYILTSKEYFKLFSNNKVYDITDPILYTDHSSVCPIDANKPTPAYVIYTSGSTGNPKGVVVEQHAVLNLIEQCSEQFTITSTDRLSKFSAFGFDASVIEIFLSLLNGCTLYFVPEATRIDIKQLNDFFHQHKISFAFLPTKFAELFMELKNQSLRILVVGGEKLKQYKKNNYKLVNAYGPTEATVLVSTHTVEQQEKNISIGKALKNTKVYILNKELKPCLDEMEGEIYIGGVALASGYLNNPQLTAERFIPNPYGNNGERLYKTGDLGKKLSNGNLFISGRSDFQVKIFGYRIELSEIEKQLLHFPQITNAAVVAYEDASEHKYLCAYLETKFPINKKELNIFLARYLPEYMIPKQYVELGQFPLNYNGKTDLKALKLPSKKANDLKSYISPRNATEEKIYTLFCEILYTDKISIDDDFFLLGGNSIKAIQLVTKAQKELRLDISDIYTGRTIEKIAELADFY